jgi:hypothetical protein
LVSGNIDDTGNQFNASAIDTGEQLTGGGSQISKQHQIISVAIDYQLLNSVMLSISACLHLKMKNK